MSLGYRQTQILACECSTCGQLMLNEIKDETTQDTVLFGAVPYSVCPVCFQQVNEKDQTDEYKREWNERKEAFRQAQKKNA